MTMLAFLGPGDRMQSAVDSAGAYAAKIEWLWWVFVSVSVVVYVLVIGALIYALFHRRRSSGELHSERKAFHAVAIASAATAIILFVLLFASITTGRQIADVPDTNVEIVVTAKQWWWQVEYDDGDKSRRITSANEIYVPVGAPVRVRLKSSDVIHSFWVPHLHGKRDVVPGRESALMIRADKPGVYRGQCAEFCGLQHAKMALWVTAVPKSEYAKWADAQRKSSVIPSTPEERKGQEVFMSSPCPLCHTVSGTDASGRTGPDLSHFATRRSIAAGTVPNRRGYLAAWIVDPQHLKPGSNMPPMALQSKDLGPLLTYLESLK